MNCSYSKFIWCIFSRIWTKKTLITETHYALKSLKVFCFYIDKKITENLLIFRRDNLSTYLPPKSCIPSKADITINKNNKNKRLIIDFMAFMSDVTKFRKDDQYLKNWRTSHYPKSHHKKRKEKRYKKQEIRRNNYQTKIFLELHHS